MTGSALLQKLEDMEKEEGKLPALLEFYGKLLRIQVGVGQGLRLPLTELPADTVPRRREPGKPLLSADEFVLDWCFALLRDTFEEVAALFAEFAVLFGHTPEELRESLPRHILTHDTVRAWFEGAELPATRSVGATLLRELVDAAVKPFLMCYSRTLLDRVDLERWRRGYCPICGGNADFAFLEAERGARWLVCSRCDAEWLFQRLQCPYCHTTDQNDLAYYANDDGLYRLYVCEHCKHYLKTIDLRKADPGVLIPMERLLTLRIDAQARRYGYLGCG